MDGNVRDVALGMRLNEGQIEFYLPQSPHAGHHILFNGSTDLL